MSNQQVTSKQETPSEDLILISWTRMAWLGWFHDPCHWGGRWAFQSPVPDICTDDVFSRRQGAHLQHLLPQFWRPRVNDSILPTNRNELDDWLDVQITQQLQKNLHNYTNLKTLFPNYPVHQTLTPSHAVHHTLTPSHAVHHTNPKSCWASDTNPKSCSSH